MKRFFLAHFRIFLAMAIMAGLLAGEISLPFGGVAQAQEARSRPNLLEMLFGGGLRKQRQQNEAAKQKARRVKLQQAKSQASSGPARKAVVNKNENARNVLIVGDFMAGALADGLQQVYAENADIVFIDNSSGLSGLVRDDVVNWPQVVSGMIDEAKPVAVIVLVGMNDRQQMRTAQGRVEKLSQEWRAEYQARIDGVASAVRTRSLPLLWTGLPPVSSGAMNADYLVFNELVGARVEAAGGKFIDVWDGFTNASGQFVNAGPDVNGQIVRLRNSDGINMTNAGKNKLAYYVDRELRRVPGFDAGVFVSALPADGAAVLVDETYDPAATGRSVVLFLDSPALDGGDALEGGETQPENLKEDYATSYRLVAHGETAQPHAGRIDMAWGAPAETVAAKTEAEDPAAAGLRPAVVNGAQQNAPAASN